MLSTVAANRTRARVLRLGLWLPSFLLSALMGQLCASLGLKRTLVSSSDLSHTIARSVRHDIFAGAYRFLYPGAGDFLCGGPLPSRKASPSGSCVAFMEIRTPTKVPRMSGNQI